MIPVVTAAESARMDQRAEDTVETLMDRAGLAVALAAVEVGARYGSRVTVLAGPGNNGGDGYVAARYLHRRGVAVQVAALAPPRTDAATRAARSAASAGVRIGSVGAPGREDVVIDALFGGGFRRGMPSEVEPWLDLDCPVVAVDVPSGLDPDTGEVPDGAFNASRTVTFGALKVGHLLGEGPERCGEVTVADIGLGQGHPVLKVVEDADAARPARTRTSHKWSAGSVLVVGGAAGMVGAAVMAGRAALSFGASAVGVVSPQAESVTLLAPELLTYPLTHLREQLGRYDVVVVGPGLGDEPEVVETVLGSASLVLADADALRYGDRLASTTAGLIVTPHQGEFSRLTAADPGPAGAAKLAESLGGVVLLKGAPTLVTDGETPWVVNTGGPELATIGSGDVLAGMVAALWARGLSAVEAARSGAYWHGVAGSDLARETSVTADRLARHVGRWAGTL